MFDIYATARFLRSKIAALVSTKAPYEEQSQFSVVQTTVLQNAFLCR